jgi:hypothetical protein
LLEDYQDFTANIPSAPEETSPTPIEEAKAAATESGGGSAPVVTEEKIYEADVIELINSNPAKYRSPSFQKQLVTAIQEGRYVKLS